MSLNIWRWVKDLNLWSPFPGTTAQQAAAIDLSANPTDIKKQIVKNKHHAKV